MASLADNEIQFVIRGIGAGCLLFLPVIQCLDGLERFLPTGFPAGIGNLQAGLLDTGLVLLALFRVEADGLLLPLSLQEIDFLLQQLELWVGANTY